MKTKRFQLIIFSVLLAMGISFVWWASIPRQPFKETDKISILAVKRITSSQFSNRSGEEPSDELTDEIADVTDQINLQQLAAILRLLRTNRMTDPPVGPHKGGYLTPEIQYEVHLAYEGDGACILYIGNRYDGRLQYDSDNDRAYPIQNSAAWFSLLEELYNT